jgi:hypothetical protein
MSITVQILFHFLRHFSVAFEIVRMTQNSYILLISAGNLTNNTLHAIIPVFT